MIIHRSLDCNFFFLELSYAKRFQNIKTTTKWKYFLHPVTLNGGGAAPKTSSKANKETENSKSSY